MNIKDALLKLIRSGINPAGYDIVKVKTTNPAHLIYNHLVKNKITVVLDIGANEGQYSQELRKAGYKGRIVSFEPLVDAYENLKTNSSKDGNWESLNYALGDTVTIASIHVSGHSPSSSFLPMTEIHRSAAPGSEYVKEEKIEIKTLDSVFESLALSGQRIFLKADTQGYEMKVLLGAKNSLDRIAGIQLELSATRLYEGEENYYSICSFLENHNFRLVRVIPGFTDKKSGVMLQFDAIFFKNEN